ncbi:MAG: hypothetical protein P8I99_05570 [Acidimicrobiales bacterium]|nr:hypothetical protein [Acidimicrobiales bacterium]MDG1876866.1 hypothetical protein [Acidimicrobiales bacterium]
MAIEPDVIGPRLVGSADGELRLELDRLNDASDAVAKLENAFIKGFPSYARKAKVASTKTRT